MNRIFYKTFVAIASVVFTLSVYGEISLDVGGADDEGPAIIVPGPAGRAGVNTPSGAGLMGRTTFFFLATAIICTVCCYRWTVTSR